MFAKISPLVVLAICLLAGTSEAQECVAESVVNLTLEASHLLTWSLRPGEPCEVSEYLIYIFHPDQPTEHTLNVTEPYVDVSFLEICEEWVFVVVPVSGNTLGGQRRLSANLPLPEDADLSLAYLNITEYPATGQIRFDWNLTDNRLGNCSVLYRLTIKFEGDPIINNYYLKDLYYERFLPSCRTYEFGIRTLNTASPGIEGPELSKIYDILGRKQNAPSIDSLEVGATWANFSVTLETEARNPCPLVALHIEAMGAFSQIIPLTNESSRSHIPITITDLKPSKMYEISVYVDTSVGWSNFALVAFITPSEDDVELDKEQPKEIEGSA